MIARRSRRPLLRAALTSVRLPAFDAAWRSMPASLRTWGRCVAAPLLLAVGTAAAASNVPPSEPAVPVVRSLLEIRRAHVVIQQWDLSCGAAALTTLLKYQHGEPVTEKQVAASLMRRPEYIAHPELIQIREGFSLLDIKRDVDARGYRGSGFGRLELADLLERAPLLVPIQVNGYNHFVVFRGAARGYVLLADPAWGNRTMPVAEFLTSWIDYPAFGHVGFTVQRRDALPDAGIGLAPVADDFPFVR